MHEYYNIYCNHTQRHYNIYCNHAWPLQLVLQSCIDITTFTIILHCSCSSWTSTSPSITSQVHRSCWRWRPSGKQRRHSRRRWRSVGRDGTNRPEDGQGDRDAEQDGRRQWRRQGDAEGTGKEEIGSVGDRSPERLADAVSEEGADLWNALRVASLCLWVLVLQISQCCPVGRWLPSGPVTSSLLVDTASAPIHSCRHKQL